MNDDKRMITKEEAVSLLNDGDTVHTFLNAGGILLGADMSRESIVKLFEEHKDEIEIAGETARKMKHGIAVWEGDGPLFIETNPEKLNAFDPIE